LRILSLLFGLPPIIRTLSYDLSPIRSGIGQVSSCSNAPLHYLYAPLFAFILVYFFHPGNGAYVSELIQSSNKCYEIEVKSSNMSQIYNVCMIESHASLYVKMIDVLVGAVNFDCKNYFNKNIQVNKVKKGIVNYLKKKLGVTSLAQNMTIHKPN